MFLMGDAAYLSAILSQNFVSNAMGALRRYPVILAPV